MPLIPTRAPGSVGLEVSRGPDGGLYVSVHVPGGYLEALLTRQEASWLHDYVHTLLMSQCEPTPAPSGSQASSDPSLLPRWREDASVAT